MKKKQSTVRAMLAAMSPADAEKFRHEAQLAAWRRWAKKNKRKIKEHKKRWEQSEKGRAWLKANQAKKNKARDAWRARKRAEAAKTKKHSPRSSNIADHAQPGGSA